MLPFQANRALVQRQRLEPEVVEERRGKAYSSPDQVVRTFVLVKQEMQECGKVGAVVTQETIVVHERPSS